MTALANLGLSKVATLFEDWDSYDDYKILYHKWLLGDLPVYESCWDQDRWFAYQFLNSSNPVSITRCDAIPSKFPVTDNDVKAFLDRGNTLQQEIKVSKSYKLYM